MKPTETIAAIATPPGKGGVAIVRLSGAEALDIAREVTGKTDFKPRTAVYCQFNDVNQQALDQGLVLYFSAPHSFTGEHVIELHGHGGPVVMDMLMQRVLSLGARIARPGEFSERAFLNNKLDLTQAEAIADLIDSSTVQAARLATRSMQGEFTKRIKNLVNALIHLRMYVEAAIDFPEEEIDFLNDGKVGKALDALRTDLMSVQKAAATGRVMRDGLKLVIAGPTNAGKSSLLNALIGDDVAIVTDVPGTTRDVLREQITIEGLPVHIVDTAGLRETENIIEKEGIRRTYNEIHLADCILWVMDDTINHTAAIPEPTVKDLGIPVIYIRNKVDLSGREAKRYTDQGETFIKVSAHAGTGLSLLKTELHHIAGLEQGIEGEFIARRRHLDALEKASCFLDTGCQSLIVDKAGECLAEDLRQAQQALSEITGEFTADDLLGEIFSNFCIGK